MLLLSDKEKKLLNQRAKGGLSFTEEVEYLRTWGGEIFAFLNHQRLDNLGFIPANSSIQRTFEFFIDEKDQITIKVLRRTDIYGRVEQKPQELVFPSKLKDVLLKVLDDHIEGEEAAYIKAQDERSARMNISNTKIYEELLCNVDRAERGLKKGIDVLRQNATELLESIDDDGFYSKKLSKVNGSYDALRSFTNRERLENVENKINRLFDDNAGLCCTKINHYRFIKKSFATMF